MSAPLEYCCKCGAATGRAGRADDSLYTDDDDGPFCEDCYEAAIALGDDAFWIGVAANSAAAKTTISKAIDVVTASGIRAPNALAMSESQSCLGAEGSAGVI